MQLLVSVANSSDASAARAGGADIIDAKDPLAGALGAVTLDTFRQIANAVAGAAPLSAALGDASGEFAAARLAAAFAREGASFVKVGFSGVTDLRRAAALLDATIGGAREGAPAAPGGHPPGVIAVAYADSTGAARTPLIDVAARAGARGILLDTADKSGPGLRTLIRPDELEAWVHAASEAGLLVAVAGKLTAEDMAFAKQGGADIVGVRGAACTGGRTGVVVTEKVRGLRALCADLPAVALQGRTRVRPADSNLRRY